MKLRLLVIGLLLAASKAMALPPIAPQGCSGSATGTAAAVGTNTGRHALTILNTHATLSLVCDGGTPTYNDGGVLLGPGGSYTWNLCDQYDRCEASQPIKCITAGSTVTYRCEEVR